MKHIYIFVGTTAELIKVAPIIKELKAKKIKFKLIATGQNDINFQEFEWYFGKVKPDITFDYKNEKSSIFYFSIWAMKTFIAGLFKLDIEFRKAKKKNILLIVHGDTVSSLIGAAVGKILEVKVAHIESGLRSFNFLEPFPEEISRIIISRIADIHFCPNEWACKNLSNVDARVVNTQQNTLYDIYKSAISQKEFRNIANKIKGKYYVLIMHRQEHVLFDKKGSLELLKFIMKNSKLKCILLTHEISKSMLKSMKVDTRRVIKMNRMPYFEFVHLLRNAEFIATDGGSNQEESFYMGKPTLILRKRTERIEGLGETAVLSKMRKKNIKSFLNNYLNYKGKEIKKSYAPAKIIIGQLI